MPRGPSKWSLLLWLALPAALFAQPVEKLHQADRVRIAEAFRVGEELGDKVWPGWNRAPFAVLLISPETEYLIRHPAPDPDFTPMGYDNLLKSNVYSRKRVFAPNLLATFPAVGGISTIVIGQPEKTDVPNSTRWVLTLLHEHFHQLQDSQAGMVKEIGALGLARGDTSGMWMLNFAFPYAAPELNERFHSLCQVLAQAMQAGEPDFAPRLAAYRQARAGFTSSLTAGDYKYLSFQLWKEGVARYTEYRVAALASTNYTPSAEFRALPDYKSFGDAAHELRDQILSQLQKSALKDEQRMIFYPYGAAEALLLDRADPAWHKRYLSEKFFLEKYFPN